jgi:hypothetical protein
MKWLAVGLVAGILMMVPELWLARQQEVMAQGTLVRTAVTGVGESVSRAENAAKRAAYDAARGNYRTLTSRTTKAGTLYTCVMTIEYRVR